MSTYPLSHQVSQRLRQILESALRKAYQNAVLARQPDRPYEWHIVGELVHQIVEEVNNATSPPPLGLVAGGVYVHGSPKVLQQSNTSSTEIGDLLVIVTHASDPANRHALLLQAKMQAAAGDIVPDNSIQYDLYSKWPAFKYASPRALKGAVRNVTPKVHHGGAKYLGVEADRRYFHAFNGRLSYVMGRSVDALFVTASTPPGTPSNYGSFLDDLVGLAAGQAGRVATSPTSGDGWSEVIEDLLTMTGGFTRASTRSRQNRVMQLLCFASGVPTHTPALSALINEDDQLGTYERWSHAIRSVGENQDPPDHDAAFDNDALGGISIIELHVDDEQ